jgi:hypothetical protein
MMKSACSIVADFPVIESPEIKLSHEIIELGPADSPAAKIVEYTKGCEDTLLVVGSRGVTGLE